MSDDEKKKDLTDAILNSQFAFGLGSGLGQRCPELIESMEKTFGKERTRDIIDDIINQYKKGQGGQGEQSDSSRQSGIDPNSNLVKELEDVVKIFKTLKELSSNPLQKAIEDKVGELAVQQAFSRPTLQDQIANNPALQKMIVENAFYQLREQGKSEQEKSGSKVNIHNEEEYISIHEKLSPEDVYIIRIIRDELEVVENHDGEVVYKRVKLSS